MYFDTVLTCMTLSAVIQERYPQMLTLNFLKWPTEEYHKTFNFIIVQTGL